jgi:SAM-dependent methyltransferase
MLRAICNNLARMAVAPFQERGVVETFRSVRGCLHALQREREEGFDRTWGTDTERHLSLDALSATGDDVMPLWRYFPTLRAPFQRIMQALAVSPEETTFVDLGCGKGRVLMMASDLPFHRIVGVELSPALLEVARRNLDIYRSPAQRCHAFELACVDAARWQPPDEPLVVYLFQPFPAHTMAAVMSTLRSHPHETTIAYVNPLFHQQVVEGGAFMLQERSEPELPGEFAWAIYTTRR